MKHLSEKMSPVPIFTPVLCSGGHPRSHFFYSFWALDCLGAQIAPRSPHRAPWTTPGFHFGAHLLRFGVPLGSKINEKVISIRHGGGKAEGSGYYKCVRYLILDELAMGWLIRPKASRAQASAGVKGLENFGTKKWIITYSNNYMPHARTHHILIKCSTPLSL